MLFFDHSRRHNSQAYSHKHRLMGFSLIEVMMVITVLGIIVSFAGVNLSRLDSVRLRMTAVQIQSDIRHAQRTAMNFNVWTYCYLETASNPQRYHIQWYDASMPGWKYFKNPATFKDYVVTLGQDYSAGVTITNTDIPFNYLLFTIDGTPCDATTWQPAGVPYVIDLNSKVRLTISPETGNVAISYI